MSGTRSRDDGQCRCGARCITAPSEPTVRLLDAAGEGFRAVTLLPLSGFCCPLCLRVLPDRCASLAHYPAAAIGGRRKTLLCKRCNSFLGTTYEPDSVTMAKRSAVGEETGYDIPGFVMAPPGGPWIRREAHVGRDPETGQYHFDVLPMRRRNPHIEAQLESMRDRLDTPEVHLPYPNSELARLGALSWGYLALFDFLGYSFVLSPALGRVRRVLLQATSEHLGLGTLLGWGDLPSPFERPEPVLLLANAGKGSNDVVPLPIAVGARMGRHAAVFPLADDLTASVYDRLDGWFSPSGRLEVQVVDMPWVDAFGKAANHGRLREAASWTWTGRQAPIAIVRHDVARARVVCAAPVSIGELPEVSEPPDWRRSLRVLPGEVAPEDWVGIVADTLSATDSRTQIDWDIVAPLLSRAAELTDAEAVRMVLRDVLGLVDLSHVVDMHRIFLLGEDVRSIEEIPSDRTQDAFAGMLRRVTRQRVVGGHVDHRVRGRTGVKATVLVWPEGHVVVGEYYTRHTLLMAATEAVRAAVRRS